MQAATASVRGLRRSHGVCCHPREHIEVAPRAAGLGQIVLQLLRLCRNVRVLSRMQTMVGCCLGVQRRFVRRVRRVRMLRAVP